MSRCTTSYYYYYYYSMNIFYEAMLTRWPWKVATVRPMVPSVPSLCRSQQYPFVVLCSTYMYNKVTLAVLASTLLCSFYAEYFTWGSRYRAYRAKLRESRYRAYRAKLGLSRYSGCRAKLGGGFQETGLNRAKLRESRYRAYRTKLGRSLDAWLLFRDIFQI